ncbi:MAG TPA: biotin/lipoyl-containing protein [Polyangiaceae bacterium]|nr:biotin/lipoyl-containing protein [Polyangiaceae bacterium]
MKLQINIDGKQYEAEIEVLEEERREPLDYGANRPASNRRGGGAGAAAPAAQPEAAGASSASDDKVCKSSIVGIVVKVLVNVGQTVNAGEPLLVLEAMKMESNVVSPQSGKVKAVPVAVGQSVKKGQVLVEFE